MDFVVAHHLMCVRISGGVHSCYSSHTLVFTQMLHIDVPLFRSLGMVISKIRSSYSVVSFDIIPSGARAQRFRRLHICVHSQ